MKFHPLIERMPGAVFNYETHHNIINFLSLRRKGFSELKKTNPDKFYKIFANITDELIDQINSLKEDSPQSRKSVHLQEESSVPKELIKEFLMEKDVSKRGNLSSLKIFLEILCSEAGGSERLGVINSFEKGIMTLIENKELKSASVLTLSALKSSRQKLFVEKPESYNIYLVHRILSLLEKIYSAGEHRLMVSVINFDKGRLSETQARQINSAKEKMKSPTTYHAQSVDEIDYGFKAFNEYQKSIEEWIKAGRPDNISISDFKEKLFNSFNYLEKIIGEFKSSDKIKDYFDSIKKEGFKLSSKQFFQDFDREINKCRLKLKATKNRLK